MIRGLQIAGGGKGIPSRHADDPTWVRIIGIGITGAAAGAVLTSEVVAFFMREDRWAATVIPADRGRESDVANASHAARIAHLHYAVVVTVGHAISAALCADFAQHVEPSGPTAAQAVNTGVQGRTHRDVHNVGHRVKAFGKIHPVTLSSVCVRDHAREPVPRMHREQGDLPRVQGADIQILRKLIVIFIRFGNRPGGID